MKAKNNPISIRLKDKARISLEKKVTETKHSKSEIINNLLIESSTPSNKSNNEYKRPIIESMCQIEYLLAHISDNSEIIEAIHKEVNSVCRALK